MAHSGQELLKTADNKRPASTESDPSDLVRAGEKRRRLREIASPSVTWIIIQKVEELAAQLLSDATSLDDHVEHQFQTDGVHTSELDTFNTLLSELKCRLDLQQNTMGNMKVAFVDQSDTGSPAYVPHSPEYDPSDE